MAFDATIKGLAAAKDIGRTDVLRRYSEGDTFAWAAFS
jgi:hypothetical protein